MTIPAQDGALRPALVRYPDGSLAGAVIVNDKTAYKTLEQGVLWVLDGSNGRVLPWKDPQGRPWTCGALESDPALAGIAIARVIEAREAEADSPQSSADTAPEAPSASGTTPASFLLDLEAMIHQRKQSLPEGSYTTHLFKSGLGKIRKKTGEEAVELILADNPETTVSEAADLIYHMTVLLCALGLSWQAVLDNLSARR